MTSTPINTTTFQVAQIPRQLRWAAGIGLGLPAFAIVAYFGFWVLGVMKPSRRDISNRPASAAALAQFNATFATTGLFGEWREAGRFADTIRLPLTDSPEGADALKAAITLIAQRGDARTLTEGELQLADTAAAFLRSWNEFHVAQMKNPATSDPTPGWLRDHRQDLDQATRALVILADRYHHPEEETTHRVEGSKPTPTSAQTAVPVEQPAPVADNAPDATVPPVDDSASAAMDPAVPVTAPAISQDDLDSRYEALSSAIQNALIRPMIPFLVPSDQLRRLEVIHRIESRWKKSHHVTADDLQAMERNLRALGLD